MAKGESTGKAVRPAWHTLPAERVLDELGAPPSGLTGAEARARLREFGPNVVPRGRKTTIAEIVWQQLRSPLLVILIVAGPVAFAFGQVSDGVVILAYLVVNVITGTVQEAKALRAIAALETLVAEDAVVLRDGQTVRLPAAELVPGDVVVLESGSRVPADLRAIEVHSLRVDESALTGESVPVSKQIHPTPMDAPLADRVGMLFSGTIVVGGAGRGVVVETGKDTEIGKISAIMRKARPPETPLTKEIKHLGSTLTRLVSVIGLLVGAIAYWKGLHLLGAVQYAVTFAIAAVPAGLPPSAIVVLAIAVSRMASRNAIVRTLASVETLGSTTVICSDKTGTLTRGEMTVRDVRTPCASYEVTGTGFVPRGELRRDGQRLGRAPQDVVDLLTAATLCNDSSLGQHGEAVEAIGDPTEVALLVAAKKVGIDTNLVRTRYRRVDTIPFDSETKYMVTLHRGITEQSLIVIKGAPEVVLRYCEPAADGSPLERDRVFGVVDELAGRGRRVMAIAWRLTEEPLDALRPNEIRGATFLGLVGIFDPPRPEVVTSIAACHGAGIAVKMITGDHPSTARIIGRELGILHEDDTAVLTGPEIAAMSRSELERHAPSTKVFARVAPEHKLRLVEALQKHGEVVAMTGDGVNDAPALKQADIGIAMGRGGTAAAREAADIVLVDDNFATITAAVEEGRRCYDNLVKVTMFLLPGNLAQSVIIVVGVVFFPVAGTVTLLPIIPAQILWVNLVTGVMLGISMAFEPAEPDIMNRPPRGRSEPVYDARMALRFLHLSVLMIVGGVGLFWYVYYGGLVVGLTDDELLRRAQTIVVTVLVIIQVFYLFECRSTRKTAFAVDWRSNPTVYVCAGLVVALHIAFVYVPQFNAMFQSVPLGWRDWLAAVAVSALVFPVEAVEKKALQPRA